MSRNIRLSGSGWTKSPPMSNRNVLAIVRDANVHSRASLSRAIRRQETKRERGDYRKNGLKRASCPMNI